ncbi:MAG: hypothetical protein Q9219_002455 [cf. Caloplaca sp. 3 TL-2023]
MPRTHVPSLLADGHLISQLRTHKQLWLLGENHPYYVDTAPMGLTKEDLLSHSRYIRDILVPKLAKAETVVSEKYSFDFSHLRSALEQLHDSPMSIEILSFSRIEKALQRIVESQGGGWPPDIVTKAKNLIAKWEESLGPLQRVHTDLWGTGGRLEGLRKSDTLRGLDDIDRQNPTTPTWIVEQKCNPEKAHKDGHTEFKIGDWWLNGAAACRDGIIDNPQYQITADESVAYAIAMTQDAETNVSGDESCSYTSHPNDPGVYKLMSTINGEQRSVVRVLRSWRLQSPLAPVAGIRYDGLVTGYGVKLSKDQVTDRDMWRYTFHLKREPGQESMEKALTIPNPDQLDDWEDYKSGLMYEPEDDMTDETYGGMPGLDRRQSSSSQAKWTATMPQIHWTAPTLMVASLIVGTLFALGHHLFHASLDHTHASTSLDGYDVLGMHVSTQQFNTAVGTGFAFLVRACLVSTISIAYFQIFMWTVGKHDTKGTNMDHMDAMTSVLHDLVSLASLRIWWRRPWLWVLAIVAWLTPIASIVTPATLSVGFDFPPPVHMNVPSVDFSSLNLAAPLIEFGHTSNAHEANTGFNYMYAGPSLTVQRITDAVASQGSILPVAAPSVNSTWNLQLNGPSLQCHPVESDFRQEVLANILNYTFAKSQGTTQENCTFGPGFMAWHPPFMTPKKPMTKYLPFIIENLNSSRGPLNNDNSDGYPYEDMLSVFIAIAPTLFKSVPTKGHESAPMCPGKPWYAKSLEDYHNTSTVLRCDVHNSTYHTAFIFADGVQQNDIHVTDITDKPMTTIGGVVAYFNSSDPTDTSLQPQSCPTQEASSSSRMSRCLFGPDVLTTLSYQAVMHAFTDLLAGTISLGDGQDLQALITSTTRLSSTVLAEAPELAFLQTTQEQNQEASQSLQQRAATWNQPSSTGLVNAGLATRSGRPFQQALEELFRNITMSLMSASDLQPNVSSIYYPDKTEVKSSTRENIYIYAASKLWLAYGLSIGASALIALFGVAAIASNNASFSNRFSTILRLSRGAQLNYEINHQDMSGRDPLPAYAKKVTVRFPPEQVLGTRDGSSYKLVDKEGKDDGRESMTQGRHSE